MRKKSYKKKKKKKMSLWGPYVMDKDLRKSERHLME